MFSAADLEHGAALLQLPLADDFEPDCLQKQEPEQVQEQVQVQVQQQQPAPRSTRHFRFKLLWSGSNKEAGTFNIKSTTTKALWLVTRLQKAIRSAIPLFENYWSVKVCCGSSGLEITPNPKLGLHYRPVPGQQPTEAAWALRDHALRTFMSCQVSKSSARTGSKRKLEPVRAEEGQGQQQISAGPLLLSCYSTREQVIGMLLCSNDKQAIDDVVGAPTFLQTTDRELVLAAVRATRDAHCMLNNANASIRLDERLAVAAIHSNASHESCRELCTVLLRCSAVFRKSTAVVEAAVQQFPDMLRYAHGDIRNDRSVVLCAVAAEGQLLAHASEALRADRDVVLTAVSSCGYALQHASDALRADRSVVLKAVASAGLALEFALQPCRSDMEVVLCAVGSHPGAFKYACEALRGNRDVVMHALASVDCAPKASHDLLVLKYASDELRADRDLVLLAYSKNYLENMSALCDGAGLPIRCNACAAPSLVELTAATL